MNRIDSKSRFPELAAALRDVRHYFGFAGLFSAAVNLLMLTPIIYMLQVYDRVVSSGSVPTLTMLTILMVCLLLALGGFEWVRSMVMIGASNRLEQRLRQRISEATFNRALLSGGMTTSAQPMNDLSQLRQYLTGPSLFAFFDAPWVPIYLIVMYLFHPYFALCGVFAVMVMLTLALANEKTTSRKLQDANSLNSSVNNQLTGSLRNAEVIAAMGMGNDIRARQEDGSERILDLQTTASRQAGVFTSMSKSFRLVMQSLTLGLGALLALQQEISPGMMIAGSLLLGRALAPIDLLVATWRGFSVARAQYNRLGELLEQLPPRPLPMPLPDPRGQLSVEGLFVLPPASQTFVVRNANFDLAPGEALGIVGPSASGKSSLARAILGVWPSARGAVRLDGAEIFTWDRDQLGRHLGYLPQDIELFDGSIADNICRFGQQDSDAIVAAARLAGVHDLILELPQGYNTMIGGSGGVLSGGQRQRIGLARAVYGNPCLIVLDEPNSNLDDQGEKELVEALERIKQQGSTIIVISHRTMVLQSMDKMLVLKEGAPLNYGPRSQVLAALMKPAAKLPQSAAR
ncbi:MAG: type I secretion system permease/ATPase [Gammaproteobacteria bacterium]|nr:type I secretion system permease/ATPase [Gammaproteobacteria bacterium]MCY3690034.1 type I secretion system permease/ATPase [Gammaproteobacteria bacterium]MDE0480519.1 type I secretion system permease/ATPase [Gammaproteobacteria bacterium]MDE0507961.1 type I secretion system permease/ATPase [Gammaproteobacteria bacterium]MXX06988.1 type I secretion system permease/ATPase [Gammaproteobacteria bacterium]